MKYRILRTLFMEHATINPKGCSRSPVVIRGSISVLAPWQHLLYHASFVILDALHGDGITAPSSYIQGPNWVRDRRRRVRCQAGFQRKRRVIAVGQNYRSKRSGVLSLSGTASAPPRQRDPVKHPTGSIPFIPRTKVGRRWRVPWQTVLTRLCVPVFAGRLVGKTPPRSNGEWEFYPNRLMHSTS